MQATGNRSGAVAAILALLILAGCQSAGRTVSATGENDTGMAYLEGIRAEAGLSPLRPDAALERAALEQAVYMAEAGAMKHTTGFRRSFACRMQANGVPGTAAENIAHGAFGPDELFQRWMDSPPHRRNMLDARYTRFGLAAAGEADGNRRYWALVVAK